MPEHDAPWTVAPWSLGTVAIVLDERYYEAPNEAIIYCGPDAVQNENEIRVEGPDARANARLIAAAPALYGALKAISDMLFLRPDMVAVLRPRMGPAEHAAFAAASAALALARGETND